VADALSRKPKGLVASLLTEEPYLLRELEKLQVEILLPGEQTHLAALQVTSTIVDRIKIGQQDDPELGKMIQKVKEGNTPNFSLQDGVLKFRGRLCVPNHPSLKWVLLKESHDSLLSTHPESTKMYHDLKSYYGWPGIKREIAEYVAWCLTCQRIKTKHQKPGVYSNLYPYQCGNGNI